MVNWLCTPPRTNRLHQFLLVHPREYNSEEHSPYQETGTHRYDFLRALDRRLKPSDKARSLLLEKENEKLEKGPGSRRYIKTEAEEQQKMYIDAATFAVGRSQR